MYEKRTFMIFASFKTPLISFLNHVSNKRDPKRNFSTFWIYSPPNDSLRDQPWECIIMIDRIQILLCIHRSSSFSLFDSYHEEESQRISFLKSWTVLIKFPSGQFPKNLKLTRVCPWLIYCQLYLMENT